MDTFFRLFYAFLLPYGVALMIRGLHTNEWFFTIMGSMNLALFALRVFADDNR